MECMHFVEPPMRSLISLQWGLEHICSSNPRRRWSILFICELHSMGNTSRTWKRHKKRGEQQYAIATLVWTRLRMGITRCHQPHWKLWSTVWKAFWSYFKWRERPQPTEWWWSLGKFHPWPIALMVTNLTRSKRYFIFWTQHISDPAQMVWIQSTQCFLCFFQVQMIHVSRDIRLSKDFEW